MPRREEGTGAQELGPSSALSKHVLTAPHYMGSGKQHAGSRLVILATFKLF